jgi:hypothetical protein
MVAGCWWRSERRSRRNRNPYLTWLLWTRSWQLPAQSNHVRLPYGWEMLARDWAKKLDLD